MKKSFSIIETVFAIVILSIVISSVPMLATRIGESARNLIAKEILFRTMVETKRLSMYRWDEYCEYNYSSEDMKEWFHRILETNSSNFRRYKTSWTREYKPNYIEEPVRQYYALGSFSGNTTRISATPPEMFKEPDEDIECFDDIDDWNGVEVNISGKVVSYILKYRVFYLDDQFGGYLDTNSSQVNLSISREMETNITTNMKYIEISGIEDENHIFKFHYVATNIGEEGIIWQKDLESGNIKKGYYIGKRYKVVCE